MVKFFAQIWYQFAKNFHGPPIFKIWQTTPNFQNMTDNSVFPFSSQLKRLPDFKKRFCRLDWTLLYGNFIGSCIRQIFDLPRLGSPRCFVQVAFNLSNKVILGRHLPPFLSPLQWHNAENFYGFVFTCGHFVFFVFKVYLDQVKNLIIIFFLSVPVYRLFISLLTYVICLSEENVRSSLDWV